MCGICGVFEYRTGKPVDRGRLQRMNDTLVQRGPDEEGLLQRDGVGLAMRRLSIIDRAGGHQPIANEDETAWIILNGEIYNFQSLRQELLTKGHRFRTHSDTEVILHLYEEYGEACVEKLDGMFAFAIYDARRARDPKLFIARDRVGKKPLYYADVQGALVFGSEIKPLLLDPRIGRELDHEALQHYLTLKAVPAPYSVFRDIRKLPPGSVLVCDASGVLLRRYWNYVDHLTEERDAGPSDVETVRRLLYAAVEKRLIAEVPLGAFLSGGLDSSIVVAMMSRLKGEPVKTFSVGFAGQPTHNELPRAKVVAQHCGTDHHELLVQPNIVELLPEITRFADEPFAVSSAIPTYLLAKEARKSVTVVLTGDGGDEVFGGYGQYQLERWARTWRHLPKWADTAVLGASSALGGRVDRRRGRLRRQIERFVANARRPIGARRLGWANVDDSLDSLMSHPGAVASTAALLENLLDGRLRGLSTEAQCNALDVLVWLPDEMLVKVDRMTMGASVEARSPLLDWKLIEFLAGITFKSKIPGRRTQHLKGILRTVASELLPPEVLAVPKWGFNVPLDAWFRAGAGPYLKAHLSPERIRARGVFNPEAVASLLARHEAGAVNASNPLYALLVFEVWAEAYL